ncbi:MAG: Holliday junction branch migration protein RuvA [bacterium]|nr:Holliday junction branch migration protein RuvA [bacterium]
MIYCISGILEGLYEDFIIINVSGIGYQIYVPQTFTATLPPAGEEIKIFTYHYIREDQQLLFGFSSVQDRGLFVLLTSVSGIGPKLAVKFFSAISPENIVSAIIQGDSVVLNSIPGIGKKTAERIIIELKDKIPKIYDTNNLQTTNTNTAFTTQQRKLSSIESDLTMALKTLGYKNDEIKRALSNVRDKLNDDLTLEQGIKLLLKYI